MPQAKPMKWFNFMITINVIMMMMLLLMVFSLNKKKSPSIKLNKYSNLMKW